MEPCPRENSGVPPVGGESLMVDTVMVNNDRVKETCAYKPWMLFERKPRRKEREREVRILRRQALKGRGHRWDRTTLVGQGNRNKVMGPKMECRLSGGLNYARDWGKLKVQKMETNLSNQRSRCQAALECLIEIGQQHG
ncbi:hypothetical protein Goshw_015914 [Gossypium schwendimanii]|uniref:Uncharacterized protein n=1 Tax=Gossypium schwendimanii TaxID=34291 RepID=A0A7J9LPN4_GOSSC|nr:hypothetical protein [Gossypium schwendimanii]